MVEIPKSDERHRIVHTTRFHFDRPARDFRGLARLTPNDPHWRLAFSQLVVRPLAQTSEETRDAWGNRVRVFRLAGPLEMLEVTGNHVVVRRDKPEKATGIVEPGAHWLAPSPAVPLSAPLRDFWRPPARRSGRTGPDRDTLRDLARCIGERLSYDPSNTTPTSTAAEVLRVGGGVCSDLAHVAIAALRTNGIPALYTWGVRLPGRDHAEGNGKRRRIPGRDESHAWVAAYLSGEGWCEFDPTTGDEIDGRYVGVARGRDLGDVQPVEGRFEGATRQKVEVRVDVEWVAAGDGFTDETPRRPRARSGAMLTARGSRM